MPFLPPNQQRQRTEGTINHNKETIIANYQKEYTIKAGRLNIYM